jgi:hypothetical protein
MAGRLLAFRFNALLPVHEETAPASCPHGRAVSWIDRCRRMGLAGAEQVFEGEVVRSRYHLDDPMVSEEAARKRLAFLSKSAPLIVIDGEPMFEKHSGRRKNRMRLRTTHSCAMAPLVDTAPRAPEGFVELIEMLRV